MKVFRNVLDDCWQDPRKVVAFAPSLSTGGGDVQPDSTECVVHKDFYHKQVDCAQGMLGKFLADCTDKMSQE